MFNLAIFLCLFFISHGYITLDEESLIILASFVWLDATGSVFSNTLEGLLVKKGASILDTFFFFLKLKKDILSDLLNFYQDRASIKKDVAGSYIVGLKAVLYSTLLFYVVIRDKSSKINVVTISLAKEISDFYNRRISSNLLNVINTTRSNVNKVASLQSLYPVLNYGELDFTKLELFSF